jgi:hypothetical protein
MKKKLPWSSLSILSLIGIITLFLLPAPLVRGVTTTVVVVTPADLDHTSSDPAVVAADGLNKWFMYNDTNDTVDNTLGSFVTGPGNPPHGMGSVQFTLAADPMNRKNIATYQFSGTSLASITVMSFSAYSHSGVAGTSESPFLSFNVDFTGTSGTFQRRLVYVPSANTGGTVSQDTWNQFDVINNGNALWTWSGYDNTHPWPDGNTTQYRTWNAIKTAFPNARLLPAGGWLGVRVGEPGPTGYTANIDFFTLGTAAGTTVFVFEPTAITVQAQNINATEGASFSGQVATGTFPGDTASLTASINWGDGRFSSGTVTSTGIRTFKVNGTHTYTEEGSYPLTVTVIDSSSQTATSSGTAMVGDALLSLNSMSVFVLPVFRSASLSASFTDANPSASVSDFQATIDWGDGTITQGTIAKNLLGNSFSVSGSHTYRRTGTFTVTLTIRDDGGSMATGTRTAIVVI